MWRWHELLPVAPGEIVSLGEDETPLIALGAETLLVKDEGRLPTGSFKARGIAMAVSMAKRFGVSRIAMPSNGNAGAALAAYAARAGIEAVIFCPADTPAVNLGEMSVPRRQSLAGRRDDRRLRRDRRRRRRRRPLVSTFRR